MTEDLDREAALLIGWRYFYMTHHPHGYGRDDGPMLAVFAPSVPQFNMPWARVPDGVEFDVAANMDSHIPPFRPTSNPVDTRALEQHILSKGWRIDVAKSASWCRAYVYQSPSQDGPLLGRGTADQVMNETYDLAAVTRACVEALKAWAALKEAQ